MTFNGSIPQPGDFLSTSQGDLLANMQFLADTSTRSGITNGISVGGYYDLPNGLTIQYFRVTGSLSIVDGTTIPFLVAFDQAPIYIGMQGVTNTSSDTALWVNPNNITSSSFSIRTGTSKEWTSGIFVLAIGLTA